MSYLVHAFGCLTYMKQTQRCTLD